MRPAGRPRRGRARAPPARRPPCPSARFLRRRLRDERGAQLLPPRPAPAGVGEAAEAPPAPPTPEAARPPRGHLRRWHNGSPSAGGGSASPLLPSSPHIHTQSLPPTPPLPPSAAAAAPATRAPGGRAGLTPPPCPPRSRRSPLTPGRGSPRPAARRHARARHFPHGAAAAEEEEPEADDVARCPAAYPSPPPRGRPLIAEVANREASRRGASRESWERRGPGVLSRERRALARPVPVAGSAAALASPRRAAPRHAHWLGRASPASPCGPPPFDSGAGRPGLHPRRRALPELPVMSEWREAGKGCSPAGCVGV